MTYPILTPPIIPTAFAEGASASYITNSGLLPTASQIGITNGAASLVDGFPPLNFQLPISQGGSGIPMSGQDLNAILYMITSHLQNLNAGVRYKFSSALSSLIGGYPVGTILQDNAGVKEYINVLASNTTDFNATPASIGVSWMLYGQKNVPQNQAKAWAFFGAGGGTIVSLQSFGISSITRTGPGLYTVSISAGVLTSSNSAVATSAWDNRDGNTNSVSVDDTVSTPQSTSTLYLVTNVANIGPQDMYGVGFVIFGN